MGTNVDKEDDDMSLFLSVEQAQIMSCGNTSHAFLYSLQWVIPQGRKKRVFLKHSQCLVRSLLVFH